MAGLNASFAELIGAHPVDAAHHDVAEYDGVSGTADQFEIQLEAGILLKAGHVGADYRYLFHTCLFEGTADETDIVGSAAASACLRHNDGSAVQVVFTGLQSLHDLSHYEERGIAGVVVDIFEAKIYSAAVVVGEDNQVVAAGADRGLKQIKVDRRHLGRQDRVVLAHFLCEGDFFDSGVVKFAPGLLGVADPDSRNQGTHADAGASEVVDLVYLEAGVDLGGRRIIKNGTSTGPGRRWDARDPADGRWSPRRAQRCRKS